MKLRNTLIVVIVLCAGGIIFGARVGPDASLVNRKAVQSDAIERNFENSVQNAKMWLDDAERRLKDVEGSGDEAEIADARNDLRLAQRMYQEAMSRLIRTKILSSLMPPNRRE